MGFVEIFGWVAAVVGAFYTMPQLVRIIRTGSTAGLSLLAWQLQSAVGMSWVGHGLIYNSPQLVACNGVIGAASIGVLVLIIKHRKLPWLTSLAPTIAVTILLVAMDLWLGQLVFGFLAVLPSAGSLSAQLKDLATKPDISGVSPVFLGLGIVIQAMWFTWGIMVTDLSLILVCGTLTFLLSVSLVVWLVRSGRARGAERLGESAVAH